MEKRIEIGQFFESTILSGTKHYPIELSIVENTIDLIINDKKNQCPHSLALNISYEDIDEIIKALKEIKNSTLEVM
jgi:hypothetical protein